MKKMNTNQVALLAFAKALINRQIADAAWLKVFMDLKKPESYIRIAEANIQIAEAAVRKARVDIQKGREDGN